ncbi:acetylxylan esterase [uncultured Parabacteroides sp.]|uniref:glucuronyl esterase domain-containing protein n=1 Tax=uncultured Parabacteroides sp. TaxID=512312 RepID=UPI0025D75DD3|nr:acetylxylan esterase [uncultured Parabacteroides sp.]
MKQRLSILLLLAFSLLGLHAQNAEEANYDESKIPPFTLPTLLETASGQKVTTPQQWEQTRRPELLSIFAEQVYGKMPEGKVDVSYEKLDDNHSALDGSATRKQIEITFSRNGVERKALLLMYLPNHVKTKVPVFLHFNFQGNQTVSADPEIIPSQYSKEARGNQAFRWPLQKIIDAGYGLATVHYFDFFPDDKDKHAESILALFGYKPGDDIPTDGGQAIAAWAWGNSRVMDYLETDWQVDASKVILMGHSRLGKAALWAGALDTRFAIVVANESGCGGAALSRRQVGETVNRINNVFPHWFCKNFRRYNKKENDLPIDQHELLALIAPRPLYVASAEGDRWSDPKGEFLSASYAGDVYHLYGMKGLETTTLPAVNTSIGDRVAYHIRTGVHDVTDFDWENYIRFADKWLK